MLTRYKIGYMVKIPPDAPEAGPNAVRQDTRKHTNHCLRPSQEMVERYLDEDSDYQWEQFERDYGQLLADRFDEDRHPFDELAQLAEHKEVFLGCSCPTKKNPDPTHCHTHLALRFMAQRYPALPVEFPKPPERPRRALMP